MCSSRSVFPVNLENVGSFNPAGMIAPRMSSEKRASLANSVLVPRRVCPATLAERTSTCRRKTAIASGGGAWAAASRATAS
ncbi:hypothetical protein LIER_17387 [Lithospermum erythrorhizon]|uniref:Uncharacterized protein n=1 Tax=Lithospermum erythrorhizon TaxID=34254 RepID=A0AAV3QE94_LITER